MQSPPGTPVAPSRSSHNTTPQSLSSAARLWRPAAQRNLKNQWSKLNSLRRDWCTAASAARSHATSIVNSYLSIRYLNEMEYGVLRDMPNIQEKAGSKLSRQQELCNAKLLSSYKDMVRFTVNMASVCKSMRCYLSKSTNSMLIQFSSSPDDEENGAGDLEGIPVFAFYSIASFEERAWEVVHMFISELILKRLLVLEFLSLHRDAVEREWADEFYDGEFDDLRMLNLYSDQVKAPVTPPCKSSSASFNFIQSKQQKQQQGSSVLQIYLTIWMVNVNIDECRVEEIFGIVGSEMDVDFLKPFA
ncbi:hypothetical protein M569_02757 [Genlisea aurea]|uniref:Uncharacterized protein n=1 Tax=Genlisea aurea TaxID=192259 RepID=S8E831_9LAMI|nr:hypothetical protein M569_02757 [Genlisea aurea]